MPALRSATVIVLNYNGEAHLRACLPSLRALDYPNTTVMVADNGSRDGSLAYLRREQPQVRVVEFGTNLGFAEGYNRAVAAADTDYVALLNNDTRVSATWLGELVAAAERNGAAAAASTIVDWDGSRIDFVGGLPTAFGHSWQRDYGLPVGRQYAEEPVLFGCGGSLLVDRATFLEVGGFDADYFAYFEDVDLGWRMTLMGHQTVLAPQAVTYHRLHGTSRGWAHAMRLRLYERNALFTLCKNYGDEALARVLPTAVALTIGRNLAHAKLDGSAIHFGRVAPASMDLPPALVATLIALEDFGRALPQLMRKRAHIQARRRVDDNEVLRLMPEPLRLHDIGDRYRDTAEALIRDFRIAELFGMPSPRSAVFSPPAGAVASDAGAEALVLPTHGAVLRTDAPSNAAPVVSIVVLTASGATHLPACLDSLRQHNWPAAQTEVIVVDNGSRDDPTAVAEQHYPGVRVVRNATNLGFAGGNNAGARIASGSWIVFLNDDTRVAPDWLTQMMDVAARRQAVCVGALILDWTGERIDFAGGLVNFEGRGYSLNYDRRRDDVVLDEMPLLFGCGCAVLFRRDVFDGTRGWDEPTFAYYEDVEFGWRLWLLGHEVWFAPQAVVYHKHHGTSGAASAARVRAFERNALRMLYTHLEEPTLRQVLPAALLASLDRVLLGTAFSRADDGVTERHSLKGVRRSMAPRVLKVRLLHALSRRGARRHQSLAQNLARVGARGLAGAIRDVWRDVRAGWDQSGARTRYLIELAHPNGALDGRMESLPVATAAALLGVQDFLDMLPEMSARRAWLQAARTRTDADIIGRFGSHWMSAVPSTRLDLHVALRDQLTATLLQADARPPLAPDA